MKIWQITIIALSAATVAMTTTAHARHVSTTKLERQWLAMETECRGGNHSPDDAVCRKRDALLARIERRGICWAYRDDSVPPPEYDWHPCKQMRPR